MADVNFIELYTSLDDALSIKTSPIIQFHRHNGIQLLPNNEYPYVQFTNNQDGVELEDWEVHIVSLCGSRREDVTDFFMVERVYQDDFGMPQIEWSLTNVPFDFGSRFVYLEIKQLIGETFYSNVFQLTSLDEAETCRLDYRNSSSENMMSISVQMFFWQDLKNQEITTYYERSTRNTVTALVKSQKYERWRSKVIPNDLWLKISDVFEHKYAYINLVRAYMFEPFQIVEFTNMVNFAQNECKIAFNKSDIYDPSYVNPPELVPYITLERVVTNGYTAIYHFLLGDFNPTYLIFQRSQDITDWTNVTQGSTSPQSIQFSGLGTWYFRIMHPDAISNVIEVQLNANVVANDDFVQVEKGMSIDIPVLLNDTLVGLTTIISVSTPNNGTATIIANNTQIRYTHNNTATLMDSFTYTISNGDSSDTASVNVTVQNNTIPRYSITYSENEDITDIGVRYNDGTWKDRYLSSLPSIPNNDGTITTFVDSLYYPSIVNMVNGNAIIWSGGSFILE